MALTIKDALAKAKSDPAFAKTMVGNPSSIQSQYSLSDTQVAQLQHLGAQASKVSAGSSAAACMRLRITISELAALPIFRDDTARRPQP